ncbi:NADP-dependent malic enzyme [Candidatus Shapirobacteria bacterium]|nr:NADP-dependent malic enzyme [Candidatus Shapirobacteria bacterium]
MDYQKASLQKHLENRGKIEIKSKFGEVKTREDLSIAYTPGVAAVSTFLAEHPEEAKNYSIKGNTIAVISDGSAVLGLGNIGPLGALPVMEGKALLFKEFAGVDAYPIVLSTQDTEEIIRTVKAIAPTFGGINLEDISAPRCFEIEERLKSELNIPVMHDDQHGTAIVVLAAIINALKLVDKKKENIGVVISGVGAAGVAIAKLLHKYGVEKIVMVDSKGIICKDRIDLNSEKIKLLEWTNKNNLCGDLTVALTGADVFIGVSAPGIVKKEDIQKMADKSIVLAMANPVPEIMPDVAKAGGAFIVGTGRSDFANQINNVLAFPGVFRGALDNGVKQITDEMKLAAAEAIASCVSSDELSPDKIIPSPFEAEVAKRVAEVIK